MNDALLQRLTYLLASQQVYMTALSSALNQQGFTAQQFQKTLALSFSFLDQYKEKTDVFLRSSPDERAAAQTEREIWEMWGLGDLWRPSEGRESDEAS